MDDKIYILAIIAWIAYSFYSAYNKAKKKKEATPVPPAQKQMPEGNPWSSIPEKPLISDIKPVSPINTEGVYNYSGTETSDDTLEEMSSIENLSSETLHEASKNFSKKISYSHTNHDALNMFDTDFGIDEIRKAVIYAEIINRKY